MSGSPLYFTDEKQQKAFAVGVHVGGSKILANTAVPISYHMKTIESWNSVCPVRGKYVTALETKKFCIVKILFSHNLLKYLFHVKFLVGDSSNTSSTSNPSSFMPCSTEEVSSPPSTTSKSHVSSSATSSKATTQSKLTSSSESIVSISSTKSSAEGKLC